MSVFSKRNADDVQMRAPLFRVPDERPPAPAPAPRINPLDPMVATLTSQAIIQAEEQHIAEVDAAIQRAEATAAEMRANFPAWAESRLAAARARAEDVASGHAEILRCKEAFDAIRSGRPPAQGAGDDVAAALPDAGPALASVAESRERLEDLARRLEAARPKQEPTT